MKPSTQILVILLGSAMIAVGVLLLGVMVCDLCGGGR